MDNDDGDILNQQMTKITLFRMSNDLVTSETSTFKRDDQNLMALEVCWQRFVPGVVTHSVIDQLTKESMAVVYRVVTEGGMIHRVRVFNLTQCTSHVKYQQSTNDKTVLSD